MYGVSLGRMASNDPLSCDGLPLDGPCWIGMTPSVVTTPGGGGDASGLLPVPDMTPLTPYSTPYILPPLVVTAPAPVAAGVPWGLLLLLAVGVYGVSRGGGNRRDF